MQRKLVLTISAALLLGACSGKDDDAARKLADAAEKTKEKLEQGVPGDMPAQIGDTLEKIGDAIANGDKSVPASSLKALLPEALAGLERVSYEAQRAGVGITVSKAQAQYGDADNQISLMITDLGAASGLAAMTRNMVQSEIDREDQTGFERTTEYKGYQSYQRVIRGGDDQSLSEVMIFVNDRFTVQLDGQNVPFKQMTKALDQIDIDALKKFQTAAKQ